MQYDDTDQHDDPLERELASMRPNDLSPDVRRQIAVELTLPARSSGPVVFRWIAAGAALAACVAIATTIFVKSSNDDSVRSATGPATTATATMPVQVAVANFPGPTLGQYRLALARSSEAAEALLESAARPPTSPSTQAPRAFGASAAAWSAGQPN